jgi:hypothetical protein
VRLHVGFERDGAGRGLEPLHLAAPRSPFCFHADGKSLAAGWWCGMSCPAGLDREDAAELRAFLMNGWHG